MRCCGCSPSCGWTSTGGLEPLVPGGLPGGVTSRSGDVLNRLVHDVDSVQDLLLRSVIPALTAAIVVAGTVIADAWLLPAAGLVLLACLLVAGLAVPWLTSKAGAAAARRVAPARGELTADVVDVVHGCADLLAYGAAERRLAHLERADAELSRLSRASASSLGVGSGLTTLATGAAVLGSVLVGVPAVRSGRLGEVALAVVVLLPLAAFEAVAPLPGAAKHWGIAREAAGRVFAVLDAPLPVREPARPAVLPPPPAVLAVEGLRVRYPVGRRLWTGRPAASPRARVAVVGPSGSKTTLLVSLLRFVEPVAGRITYGVRTWPTAPATTCAGSSACARRMPICSTRASGTTCGSRGRTPPTASCSTSWCARGSATG